MHYSNFYMKHLFALNHYFYRYRRMLFWGIFFVITSNIFGVLPPQAIRYAFDLVRDNIAYYRLCEGFDLQVQFKSVFNYAIMLFGLVVLGLALIKGLLMFFMRQTIIVMSRLIEYDLRNDIYDHYQHLDAAFYKRNRTGDLMSRVTEDVSRVRMYLGPAIMYGINTAAMLFITIFTMFGVNAELTLYVLLPLPILSLSIYFINAQTHRRSEAIQAQMSNLTSVAQEAFSGIRVVKAYVQETPTVQHFEIESEIYKQKTLYVAWIQALFSPLMVVLMGLSTLLTVWIGGQQVMAGKVTAGNIAEFVIYVNMLIWPVTSVGWVASLTQRASASQKRINEFLQTQPDVANLPDALPFELRGRVVFDKVDFTYPETGVRALQGVSFVLEKGQRMAVVGHTGSGKSTIAELLLRRYDPSSGQIEIDGIPLRKMQLADLRRQIGYVPQDVFLFSETVANNISFGMPNEVSREEIEQAAQHASVINDIKSLPHGLETLVGERGVTLSGGQKQRISLARALLKKPQMLILDDCLSAVDATTERNIIDQLDQFLDGRTAIIITHRIFSLMSFDKIVVLEDGQIVEQGTHQSLMETQSGIYRSMYEKQQADQQKVTSETSVFAPN